MVTSHVGHQSHERELGFQEVLILPAVFQDRFERPLVSDLDLQMYPR